MSEPSFCPNETLISQISGKWKLRIIFWLDDGPKRFNHLQRLLGSVTHRTLNLQLRELADADFVAREDFGTTPPHVEYSLTEKCRTLRPLLVALHDWGKTQDSETQDSETQNSETNK